MTLNELADIGFTPRAALIDYAEKIQNTKLVFNAMNKEERQEFGVPNTLVADSGE